jgi:hypothetical protein
MAKFTNKDLRLKDSQKVTWGTNLDANMWYDGTDDQLRVDVTISGVDPTEEYHLTTKYYVDGEIATTSGSLQDQLDGLTLDHGGLDGLTDDDHAQYTLADGTRGFTGTVSGVDPTESYHLATKWYLDNELATVSGGIVQDHGGLQGLGDDDHTQYTLVDGTRAFTGTVGGITPTADAHLTTKGYVDGLVQGLDWQNSVSDYWTPSVGLPGSPDVGTRYVADDSGNGWTAGNIYEWDGSQWEETTVNDGTATWFEDDDLLRVYQETATTSGWVRFGSTVTHRNLNDLQGGTSDEYYHMRQQEYYDLAFSGNSSVDDASSQHHHDGRYYTETEMDATISGLQTQITSNSDHGNLSGLGDDDHTQYSLSDGTRAFTGVVGGVTPTLDSHLTTKQYVDGEIGTISGTIDTHANDTSIHFTEASIDHGSISGLGDDDHTQYILVDGSRGFTSTVSGVTPVLGSDLATKAYVDSSDNPQQHGRAAIAYQASSVTVNFTDVGSTAYTVNATMENTSDSPPSVYAFIVSAKTSSSFTVTLMGDTDSANYILDWVIFED